MNETPVPMSVSDDEILAAIDRRLAAVERLVPSRPAWEPARAQRSGVKVRASVASGSVVALVAIAALVVAVLGPALGRNGTAAPTANQFAGGTRITFRLAATGQTPTAETQAAVKSILTTRLQLEGVRTYEVATPADPSLVIVTLPGSAPLETLLPELVQTGDLEFVPLPPADYGTSSSPGRYEATPGKALPKPEPALFDGTALDGEHCAVGRDPVSDGYVVTFTLRPEATSLFATYTTGHVGEYFAITLDGSVINAPYIQSPITEGGGQISGDLTKDRAEQILFFVRSGALPVPVQVVSRETIGTTSPAATTPVAIATAAYSIPAGLEHGMTLGDANAPVTVDVWLDFQCAACGVLDRSLIPGLLAGYIEPGRVKIVMHDFIVVDAYAGGVESRNAAIAARAAGKQNRYFEYAALLFANQQPENSGWLTATHLRQIADTAGLDGAAFATDYADPALGAAVDASSSSAAGSGVTATPTVKVNGTAVATADLATIRAAVDAALK